MSNPLFNMMNTNHMQILGKMGNMNPQEMLMNALKHHNSQDNLALFLTISMNVIGIML